MTVLITRYVAAILLTDDPLLLFYRAICCDLSLMAQHLFPLDLTGLSLVTEHLFFLHPFFGLNYILISSYLYFSFMLA